MWGRLRGNLRGEKLRRKEDEGGEKDEKPKKKDDEEGLRRKRRLSVGKKERKAHLNLEVNEGALEDSDLDEEMIAIGRWLITLEDDENLDEADNR
jgi:hypothetical protein